MARSKKEDKLQIACVNAYKFTHAKEPKNLWSTRNYTVNPVDGANQKKMGMLRGVSDLIYCSNFFVGVELKAPKTRHDSEHIQEQLDWGLERIAGGGFFYICTTVEAFLHVIDKRPDSSGWSTFKGVYCVKDIQHMLEAGTRTILFT